MRTFFRKPGLSPGALSEIQEKVKREWGTVSKVESEQCFYIESSSTLAETDVLKWLASETFEPENFSESSFLVSSQFLVTDNKAPKTTDYLLEFGPRLNFSTSWSSNAVNIFETCGITGVTRAERSRRILITLEDASKVTRENTDRLLRALHDEMTECQYQKPLQSFKLEISPKVLAIFVPC